MTTKAPRDGTVTCLHALNVAAKVPVWLTSSNLKPVELAQLSHIFLRIFCQVLNIVNIY